MARENPLSRLGTVSLDGTKVRANANKHGALSCGHAEKIEAQLKAEVAKLLQQADAAYQAKPSARQATQTTTGKCPCPANVGREGPLRLAQADGRSASTTFG